MATKTPTITLSNLRIRPYDPSSKIAYEMPGLKYFDERNDFVLFHHINHVAVSFSAFNNLYDTPRRRRVREAYHINIYDVATKSIVTSRTISVCLDADTEYEELRFDVPLTKSQICPDHDFYVQVHHLATGTDVFYKRLRFFNPHKLPTRYFSPVKAYLVDDSSDEMFRVLEGKPSTSHTSDLFESLYDREHLVSYSVVFMLQDDTFNYCRYPQIGYYMIDSVGNEKNGWCELESVSAPGSDPDNDTEMIKATVEISGSNYVGAFYVELRCMGYPFTGLIFNLSDSKESGCYSADELQVIKSYTGEIGLEIIKKRDQAKADAEAARRGLLVSRELDGMVGIESVKSKVTSYAKLMHFNRLRSEAGLAVTASPLHAMFLGSPGTGKTTVAKIIGTILRSTGVLSKGHVVVRERANLLGQYYNTESEKTLAALEEAEGGILFIDEAHQLYQPEDPRDPGRFVIETLMTALSDESHRDWMLILAGYPEPMLKMFEMNPGLASRIPSSNFYHFDDFTVDELKEIAYRYFAKNEYELSAEARRSLDHLLEHDYLNRDKSFGNARHVINIIQTGILPAMASRIADIDTPSRTDLSLILKEDIPASTITLSTKPRRIGFAI